MDEQKTILKLITLVRTFTTCIKHQDVTQLRDILDNYTFTECLEMELYMSIKLEEL